MPPKKKIKREEEEEEEGDKVDFDATQLLRFLSTNAKIPLAKSIPLAAVLYKQGLISPQKIAAHEGLKTYVNDTKHLKALLKACKGDQKVKVEVPDFHYDEDIKLDSSLKIKVNRAPYLLLFTYRLLQATTALDKPSSLSVAQALTSQSALMKAQSLGIAGKASAGATPTSSFVSVMGRRIAVLRTEDEHRCSAIDLSADALETYDARKAWGYITRSFGSSLSHVILALDSTFKAYLRDHTIDELHNSAWMFYLRTRPDISSGVAGWGEKGDLLVSQILKTVE